VPHSLYAQRSGADGACQSPAGDCQQSSPKPLLEGPVGRRFGGHGLQHGFLPVPVGLRRHAAELEITPELEQTILALLDCGRGQAVTVVTIADLADRLSVQERAVQRRIARLDALGYLRKMRQLDDAGADMANGYNLQPLWKRIDELDAQTTGGRVSRTTPPIDREIVDLDPRMDPPTPTDTVEDDCTEEGETSDLATGWHTYAAHNTGEGGRATITGSEYATPHTPAAGHDADRSALAAAMQPILSTYHEAYPAAAVGQFLGLQQRYTLDLQLFVVALELAKQRVDQRIADVDELGPIKRPVAYLYAVLAKDLAEQTPLPASSPVEFSAEEQLRGAAARLAVELGTLQPTSAASRIMRLFQRSGLPAAAFWSRMHDALRQVRQCDVKVSGKGGEPNALPLFLTILKRLLGGGGAAQAGRPPVGLPVSRPEAVPAISEPHPVWRQVLESLAGVLTPGNFARCVTAHVIEQDGTILRIAVPGVFEQQWWMRQMGRHVQGALADCGHGGLQVVFVVEATGELAV